MSVGPDRPLLRRLVKLWALLRYGPAMAHAQNWLPGLELRLAAGDVPGDVMQHGQRVAALEPFSAFARAAGREITIVGSGPSIGGQNLGLLPERTCILLNGAISLIGAGVAEPLSVAIIDERFAWRHADLIRARVPVALPCLFSVAVIRTLASIDAGWLAARRIVLLDNLTKAYGQRRKSLSELNSSTFVRVSNKGDAAFSLRPDLGMMPAGTVAYAALQAAVATGVRRIGLAGVDLTNTSQPRFYESAGSSARSSLQMAQARILAHFALAQAICTELGVTLECYSPVSLLPQAGIEFVPRLAQQPTSDLGEAG